MLMISLMILTGCRTTAVKSDHFEIPSFPDPPGRPTLEIVPSDVTEAIRALTLNLGRMIAGWEEWEIYDRKKDIYYRTVIDIITR